MKVTIDVLILINHGIIEDFRQKDLNIDDVCQVTFLENVISMRFHVKEGCSFTLNQDSISRSMYPAS